MALNESEDSVLVFDMDDVLVDVHESYRASIIATVEHFTGVTIIERRRPALQECRRLER